jgi:hypothetical protein
MNNTKTYERFPWWVVLVSTVLSLLIYAAGAFIVSRLSPVLAAVYVVYCIWLEFKILRRSCVGCYYYGRVCGFGRGVLCSFLFKKGDPASFAERQVSWADMLPDFMVFIIPIIAGIRLLIREFNVTLLMLMIVLLILSFVGNAVVRGKVACKYCKQRELGCPADRLFNKKRSKK